MSVSNNTSSPIDVIIKKQNNECAHNVKSDTCVPEEFYKTITQNLKLDGVGAEGHLSLLKKTTNCDTEVCVLNHTSVKNVVQSDKIKNIITDYFKPTGPSSGSAFLSNFNIDETLSQFEKTYKNRSFLHIPFQMRDFERIKSNLATIDIVDEFKSGIKTFGCVLNTDVSTGGGIHWFCLFGERIGNNVQLEYFNSSGREPLQEVSAWLFKTKHYLDSAGYKTDIKYTTGKQFQKNNHACGVYSICYIWLRLENVKQEWFMKTNEFNDYIMSIARKSLFIKPISGGNELNLANEKMNTSDNIMGGSDSMSQDQKTYLFKKCYSDKKMNNNLKLFFGRDSHNTKENMNLYKIISSMVIADEDDMTIFDEMKKFIIPPKNTFNTRKVSILMNIPKDIHPNGFHIDENTKVLDYGCADGSIAMEIKKSYDADVYGVDLHDGDRIVSDEVKYEQIIDGKIPFEDDMFDIITIFMVMHHINDDDLVNIIDELHRCCKGIIVIQEHDDSKNLKWFLDIVHGFYMYSVNSDDDYDDTKDLHEYKTYYRKQQDYDELFSKKFKRICSSKPVYSLRKFHTIYKKI